MAQGEPYYPIPRPANEARFQQYRSMGEASTNVSFVGRLAQYRYYNMDQVVGAALTEAERIIERMGR
jgi:UDP-galactopyranose mutase